MSIPHSRQPDPQPHAPVEAPSLFAYGAVLLLGAGLCWWALAITADRKELWASLLLNVGSGLAGAVLIFVALERRLRAAELKRLGAVVPIGYEYLFHKHLRAKIQYAQLLLAELQRIEPATLDNHIR